MGGPASPTDDGDETTSIEAVEAARLPVRSFASAALATSALGGAPDADAVPDVDAVTRAVVAADDEAAVVRGKVAEAVAV